MGGGARLESPIVGGLILFLLRCVAWTYALQPRALRRYVGQSAGWLAQNASSFATRVVEQNLSIAFKDSAEKRASFYRQAYSHLGKLCARDPAFARVR